MAAVLALHALLGLVLLVTGERLGRAALAVGVVGPLASLGWWAANLGTVLDGGAVEQSWTWVGELGLSLDLRMDGFAALMVAIVSGIGVAVFAYAWSYFGRQYEGLGRLTGLLTLFSGAMLGVVLADDLLVLYGFWELTSVTSFLLIGNQYRQGAARAAATQAILITGAGGLAMLLGFVLLGESAGTYRISELLADPPTGPTVAPALVLVLLGAFTKSAQYPFQSWLPGAMVAPTPISAYLHSATMVKAGVYVVARLGPVFAVAVALWRPVVVVVGLLTMVGGALRALRQHDLKLLLAHGTVSQLGFMMVLFGIGTEAATVAGCAVILAHALFKAALFMVVGAIDHGAGTRDVRELPLLGREWRTVKAVAVVAAASMAGVPPLFGFVAKEKGLEALADGGMQGSGVVLAALVAGSALTAAYGARFVGGVFGRWSPARSPAQSAAREAEVRRPAPGAEPGEAPAQPGVLRVHAPGAALVAPAVVLAVATVVLGPAAGLLDGLMDAAAGSLTALSEPVELYLWHGFTLPLLLSAVALGAGACLYAWSDRVERALVAGGSAVPSGDDGYRAAIAALTRTASRVTGVVQSGSMPVYLGVILMTTAVVPGVALLLADGWTGWPAAVDTAIEVPIVVVLLSAALGAAVARHRLSAALLLGVSGYAMAALFVVLGAPDLALTQAAVETLTTVLFVLALRRLPSRFARRSTPATRSLRIGISVVVGLMVLGFALAAGGSPQPRDVSDEVIARSLPDGNGRNVVNVVLVDFRGLDTLGEITVVAVAAVGAVALARAGRRPRPAPAPSAQGPGGTSRHVFVDVVVRLLVYVAVVVSLYLLVAGHNAPGGGFVGGLVAGAAVALRYISGGLDEVRVLLRVKPWAVLGAGVLIAGVTAAVPLVLGQPLLDNGYTTVAVPLVGDIGVSSALAFDLGVYLAVVGLVLMVFEALGGDTSRTQRETDANAEVAAP
jgi:multicomponent Na+:H+ antiporter subunit A